MPRFMPASPRKGFERVTNDFRISSEFFIDFLRRPYRSALRRRECRRTRRLSVLVEPITGHVVLTIESASFRDAGDLIVFIFNQKFQENYDARM